MECMVDDTSLLQHLEGKVAVVTGGANGIGAQTAKSLSLWGSKVVIADLESTAGEAERLIASLPHPTNALFVPTNVLNWEQMKRLFRRTIERFGRVDVVVANAGIMESRSVFDLRAVDDGGELEESLEGFRVLDVNLKGTLNTLRLALYHMQSNEPCFPDSSRGSIVLVTSTSGYFGSSGVGAYVASKHGLVGLLRSSQLTSRAVNIKVNAVAPFFTPTPTFSKLSGKLGASGLRANTLEDVGNAIAHICLAPGSGKCLLIAGGITKEVEEARTEFIPFWLGEEIAECLQTAGRLFEEEGYPLPDGNFVSTSGVSAQEKAGGRDKSFKDTTCAR